MQRRVDRAIGPSEVAIVQWLLDNAPVGEVAEYRLRPVAELHVVEVCDCGCCSLFFQPLGGGGIRMIADAMAVYPDGQQANLMLWGRDGLITWLEVWDCDPRLPNHVPGIGDLRTWEQRGMELL